MDHLHRLNVRSDAQREGFHGRLGGRVHIPIDEVLQQQLGVLEIGGGVVVALPVDLRESLSEVFVPPDPPLDGGGLEDILVLLDELLGAEVAVLVEEVDFEDLGAVVHVAVGDEGGDEEGEEIAEGAEADIGGHDVVVVGVEALNKWRLTRRAKMPAPSFT